MCPTLTKVWVFKVISNYFQIKLMSLESLASLAPSDSSTNDSLTQFSTTVGQSQVPPPTRNQVISYPPCELAESLIVYCIVQICYFCTKWPRPVTIFFVPFSNSWSFEKGTSDYRLLKRSEFEWIRNSNVLYSSRYCISIIDHFSFSSRVIFC